MHSLGIWFCKDPQVDEDLNIWNAYDKCTKTLQKWSLRKLSLKGRITVIKSYALPKLLYVANNMYVPLEFVKKVNNTFFQYLWENKPDKVKRETMIQDYGDGGLRMLNFPLMIKSMKAMWIKRIILNYNANWLLYLKSHSSMELIDLIKCNFDPLKPPHKLPDFYQQVLSSWVEIKDISYDFSDPWTIRRQQIQNNKNILTGGIYFNQFWRNKLDNNNIKIIHDICNENGTLMTKEQIENMYHTSLSVLEFNSLVSSIPREWKNVLCQQNISRNAIHNNEPVYMKLFTIEKHIKNIKNRELYRILIKNKTKWDEKCTHYWKDLFQCEISWKKVFALCKVDCKSKIQSFQFSIIQQFFPSNLYLSKWKENFSSACNHCGSVDTITHYFVECQAVSKLWESIEVWLNNTLQVDQNITLDRFDIMLGKLNQKEHKNVINFVVMQAKWFIYCKKLNGNEIVFKEFIQKLMYRLQIEENRYCIKGDTESFHETFDCIYKHH